MLIYTTQKKFRISCAYFFVLSTSKLLQTLKGLTDQGTIFRGCFLHDHLQFLWKAIRSKWHNFNCSKTTFLTQKYKTSLILCLINIFTTVVWNFIRIDTMLAVLSCWDHSFLNLSCLRTFWVSNIPRYFYFALYSNTHTKNRQIFESCDFRKIDALPPWT